MSYIAKRLFVYFSKYWEYNIDLFLENGKIVLMEQILCKGGEILKDYDVTVEEFAKMLNVNFRTVYNWIRSGKFNIPFYKFGGVWRASRQDIEQWIKDQAKSSGGD